MRTTLTIDEDVLRAARVRAARCGMSLSEVIEEAAQEKLGLDPLPPAAKIVPRTPEAGERKPGALAGRITIKPGFEDLPLGFDVFAE